MALVVDCAGLHRYFGVGEGRVHMLKGVSFRARCGEVAMHKFSHRNA